MTTPHTHMLTRRQALTRVVVSIALGTSLAAVFIIHGMSTSDAGVAPGTTGTAASQLSVLQAAPFAGTALSVPSAVLAGLDGGSASTSAVRLLGHNASGDSSLYGAVRSNGGACNALSSADGTVGTTCVDNLPPAGITITASDAGGWVVYGFAADGVVGVDVILDGKAQPATMLANAYTADLGTHDPTEVSALLVHNADGTTDTVRAGLQAPPSA